ncbi:MAG: hypothetical protein ABIW81_03715 [Terrimesophilobacter sp.]
MLHIAEDIRERGGFLRRSDLLAIGYTDGGLKAALRYRLIFRVRHGWYSVPDAPDSAVRAVRVGGRLTGVAALESYGLIVPRRRHIDIAVPRGACRLRRPADRRARIQEQDGVRVRWIERPLAEREPESRWRVSLEEALVVILQSEDRDIAVACCSAVMHAFRWSGKRMDAVFAMAPARARAWRGLVNPLDEAHGETFARLWFGDAGIPWEPQPRVRGVGRLDGRVSPHVYVEVDGGQHDPAWTGESESTFHKDHVRRITLTARGATVLSFDYRQLYTAWPECLAATRRAIADDQALMAYRKRHPYRERSSPPRCPARQRPAKSPNENEGDPSE